MPTFRTNLLVRDGRVGMFEAEGCSVEWQRLDDVAFMRELRAKLVEEAREAVDETDPQIFVKELADLYEVMATLAKLSGSSIEDIAAKAAARREKLGGFDARTYTTLLHTPENSDSAAYHRQYPDKYPEVK